MTDLTHDRSTAEGFQLQPYLANLRQKIDATLQNFLTGGRFPDARLRVAMQYAIFAGGKRLRPILCLASAQAVGDGQEDAMTVGCALEMIHTYSLIHDDLPAMDNDDLRRGKATCHKAFDEATAILAGDALLTYAFQILAEQALRQGPQPGVWAQIMILVARAAGHAGMIEGQMRDIAAEGRVLSADQLEELHDLKTGALISAAITSGALVAGGSERTLSRLHIFGRCIGLAFQVADDILNEIGDPHLMGKAVGTDRLRQKNTYPALMGLEGAKRKGAELVSQALRSLDIFDSKADPLRAIARYVMDRQR